MQITQDEMNDLEGKTNPAPNQALKMSPDNQFAYLMSRAEEIGVPLDLAMAIHEQESSSGRDARTSVDGAVGPMQLIPGTFKALSPQGNIYNDRDNIDAGLSLLKNNMDRYNDKDLAAGAYFSNPKAIDAFIKSGGTAKLRPDGNGKSIASYITDVSKRRATAAERLKNIPSKPVGRVMSDLAMAGDTTETMPTDYELASSGITRASLAAFARGEERPMRYGSNYSGAAQEESNRKLKEEGEGVWDAAKHGMSDAFQQVPQLLYGTAAFLGDVFGNDWLRDNGLAAYKAKSEEIAKDARPYQDLQDAWHNNEMSKWLGYAFGYSGAQIAQALATGGVGSILGKAGAKGAFAMTAERASGEALETVASRAGKAAMDAALLRGAESVAVKAAGDAAYVALKSDAAAIAASKVVGTKAAELAAAKFGGTVGLALNSEAMEIGQIYPDAVEQAQKNGEPVDLARVAGAATLAAALDVLPEMRIGGKILGATEKTVKDAAFNEAKKASERGILGRVAREVPKQMLFEGGTEGLQTPIEYWGAKKDPLSPEAIRDAINSAAMGTVGGVIGGVGAGIPRVPTPIKEVEPWVPNSPLTNAANVGTPPTPPTPPTAAAPVDYRVPPSMRPTTVDEIPAGAYNTKSPFADPTMTAMHGEISEFMREPGSIEQLRAIDPSLLGQVHQIWTGIINNPDARQDMRSDALLQLHSALNSIASRTAVAPSTRNPTPNFTPGQADTRGPSAFTGAPLPALENNQSVIDVDAKVIPEPTLQGFNPDGTPWYNTNPEQATYNAGMQSGDLTNNAPNTPPPPGGGASNTATAAPTTATAVTPTTPVAPPAPDVLGAIQQLNQKNATQRHDAIRNLVGQGFTSIVKADDGKFTLAHPKTGQQLPLGSPADVQVARTALKKLIDQGAHTAAASTNNDLTLPTPGQIEAGNYKTGQVELHGIAIAIENPQGSTRSGVSPQGKAWTSTLAHHYGYIKKAMGLDGDKLDVFIGPRPDSHKVFVVDQTNKDGTLDEHKVLMGFTDAASARQGYLANYEKGWTGVGSLTEMTVPQFKEWMAGDTSKAVGTINQPEVAGWAVSHTLKGAEGTEDHFTNQQIPGASIVKHTITDPTVGSGEYFSAHKDGQKVADVGTMDEAIRRLTPGSGPITGPIGYDPSTNRYNGQELSPGTVIHGEDGARYKVDRAGGFMLTADRLNDQDQPAGIESFSVDPADTDRYRKVYFSPPAAAGATGTPQSPITGPSTPPGPTTGPSTPQKPKPPREKKIRPENYVTMPQAKRWFEASATQDEKNAVGADPKWKMLDGVPHVFNEGFETVLHIKKTDQLYAEEGFSSPRAEKQATGTVTQGQGETEDPIQQMLDASDVAGLAAEIFGEDKIPTNPDHMPMILPGNLIRVDIEESARKEIEATLKKLGFKISDRLVKAADDTSANAEAGRLTLSAIYQPAVSIQDAGEKMEGGRKQPPNIEPKTTDPVEVQAATIIDALEKGALVDPLRGGKEQTFGAMMYLEALMLARTKSAAEFIMGAGTFGSIRRRVTGARKQVAEAIRQGYLDKVMERATRYRDLMMALQNVAAEAGPTVTEVHYAFSNAFNDPSHILNGSQFLFNQTDIGGAVKILDELWGKFSQNEESTDQTDREIKVDPKIPPRLENIIRRNLPDWRKGRNISVQGELTQQADGSWLETGDGEFTRTFGLRGVEFGNWVNQIERQANVNMAYDALMDLAHLIGVAPETLGVMKDGRNLGLAIGARGRGGFAAAHYETGNHLINLTKTMGNGTVSHEWTHALEWALRSTMEGEKLSDDLRKMMTTEFRSEIIEETMRGKLLSESATQTDRNTPPRQAALNYLFNPQEILNVISRQTNFYEAARSMDAGKDKPYWSERHELIARAFESMFFDAAKGGSAYLTGPMVADGYATKKNGYSGTPYPQGKERQALGVAIRHAMSLIDFTTGKVASYEVVTSIKKISDQHYMVYDQMGVPLNLNGFNSEARAKSFAAGKEGTVEVFGPHRKMLSEISKQGSDLADRIDKIMEELGIHQYPEMKMGSMAQSMFYHLRNGWWPGDNPALKEFAAKAFNLAPKELDLLKLKQAQEDFEAALAKYAGQLIVDWRAQGQGEQAIYEHLVEMYRKQPNLNIRTSTSVTNQAFSTPMPIGFLAAILARVNYQTKVYEPTGGNGLLSIGANPTRVIAVELDPHRVLNLNLMEIPAKQGNALTAFENGLVKKEEPDVLLTNPPFGMAPSEIEFDGYRVKGIDQQIAGKSLEMLPDNGRAVLLLGANINEGVITEKDRTFLNWLYGHYNVADHFEIPGDMYSRQGASWPIRVIVIAGRYRSERLGPEAGTIDRVKDWDDLWRRTNEALQRSETVLVGASESAPTDGSKNPDAGGVPGGNKGKNSGSGGPDATGGKGATGPDNTGGGSGTPESGDGGAESGGAGGTGNGKRSGAGRGTGGRGNGNGGNPNAGGADTGGLSGLENLSPDDIANILGGLAGGGNQPPKSSGKSKSGPTGRTGMTSTGTTPTGTTPVGPTSGVDLTGEFDAIRKILGDPKFSKGSYQRDSAVNSERYGELIQYFLSTWNKVVAVAKIAAKAIAEFGDKLIAAFGNKIIPYTHAFINEYVLGNRDPALRRKRMILEDKDNELQNVFVGPSAGDWAGIYAPKNLWDKTHSALNKLADKYAADYPEGIDQFVQNELGYKSLDEMFYGPTGQPGTPKGLAGYQVSTLALAIDQVKEGSGFIVGHDTGVGKGRIAAAMIVWAIKNGKIPIFVTEKHGLYTDMYRDLVNIGHGDIKIKMTNGAGVYIDDTEGNRHLTSNDADSRHTVTSLINDATLPGDVLFSTYTQFDGANGSRRRDAMRNLVRTGKALLIFDESHNGAGESARNEFFMEILTGAGLFVDAGGNVIAPPADWVAPPTIYSSGTFSKRSANMPLYARTDLIYPADNDPLKLKEIFLNNNQLTQVASEMLVESGQMIRLERSYAGITPNWLIDKDNTARDARLADSATEIMRALVLADRAFGAVVKDPDFINAITPLLPVGVVPVTNKRGLMEAAHHPFTSIVHNLVKQMLFAAKIDLTVSNVVASLNRGEKPVLALDSTMESALSHYVELTGITTGASLKDYSWASVFKRQVDNSRTISFKLATGKPYKFVVPWDFLANHAGHVLAEFDVVNELIGKNNIALPVSPIDAIRNELSQHAVYQDATGKDVVCKWGDVPAGTIARSLKIKEVTGRDSVIDYKDPSNPVLGKRRDGNSISIVKEFNRGDLDVLLLNVSGATGISLHASEEFDDQRPRHMFVVQPLADIAVFKQILGRINRTGQVELPLYTVLSTGIPAERRLLAVLRKKFKSLMSGTTGAEKAATDIDIVDIINEIGDYAVGDYLRENPLVRQFVEEDPGATDEDVGLDFTLKVTGKVALLSVEDQVRFYEAVENNFNQRISALDALGENPINRVFLPFEADPLEMSVLSEGDDPTKPFRSDAMMTKYEVNTVGEAPSPTRVREAIAATLEIPTSEVGTSIARGKASASVDKIDASLAILFDESNSELIRKENDIRQKVTSGTLTAQQLAQETLRLATVQTQQREQQGRKATTLHALRRTYPIGSGMKLLLRDEEIFAVVTGHGVHKSSALSGNPYRPSNFSINFSAAIPNGGISFALSQLENRANLVVFGSFTATPNLDAEFIVRSTGLRQVRYIATQNLPLAIATLNADGNTGQIVSFSENGQPKPVTGYLMSTSYKPGDLAGADYVVRAPEAAMNYLLGLSYAVARDTNRESLLDVLMPVVQGLPEITSDQRDALFVNGDTQLFTKNRVLRFNVNRSYGDIQIALKMPEAKSTWFKSKELTKLLGDFATVKGNNLVYKTVPVEVLGEVLRIVRFKAGLSAIRDNADVIRTFVDHVNAKGKASKNSATGRGSITSRVQSIVDQVSAKWKNGPAVHVYATAAEARAKTGYTKLADNTEGWYLDGQIHLIAENLHSADHIRQVLRHEAVGHYGVEQVLGDTLENYQRKLLVMEKANPKIAEIGRLVDERQPDLSDSRRAAEIIAIMAERGMQNSLVSRIIAAVRNFARNVLGIEIELNEHDVANMIRQAAQSLEGNGPKGGAFSGSGAFAASRGAPVFFSQLARAIAGAKLSAVPAAEWKSWLLGNAAKLGVKKDEIEWTGITDWLDMQTGKVAKADVLAYLDGNGVKVTEKILGEGDSIETGEEQYRRTMMNATDEQFAEEVDYQLQDVYNAGDERSELLDRMVSQLQESFDDADSRSSQPKYNQPNLVLPGGTNYREVLLTLPEFKAELPKAKAHWTAFHTEGVWKLMKDGVLFAGWETDSEAMAHRMAEQYNMNDQKLEISGFQSSHWQGTPNVLAHIRLNDRTDADGKRVLFVEEIQSDWGQVGKKKGFVSEGKLPEGWIVVEQPTYSYRNGPQNGTEWMVFDKTKTQAGFGSKTREGAIASATRPGPLTGVPSAPFVQKTEAWVSLALKRIIRMAAEEGYDKVAFVNGDQSAARYSLDKHVSSVTYSPEINGGTLVAADKDRGAYVIKETNITPEKLADYVGKDLAQKLIDQPLKDGSKTLAGGDLIVPQAGMRSFYDKIVPQITNDVLRKIGGGKVEETTFIGSSETLIQDFPLTRLFWQNNRNGTFDVGVHIIVDATSRLPHDRFKSLRFHNLPTATLESFLGQRLVNSIISGTGRYKEQSPERDRGEINTKHQSESIRLAFDKAARSLELPGKLLSQPGFTITDQMRQEALKGLPLFSRGLGQTLSAAFTAWFGDSKVVDAQGKPLVVYHGTRRGGFTIFNTDEGAYFTPDKDYAKRYTKLPWLILTDEDGKPLDNKNERVVGGATPKVYPVYLSIKNPKVIGDKGVGFTDVKSMDSSSFSLSPSDIADLKAQGYDGIMNYSAKEFIPFDSTQIKSATQNNGNFDPTNPDIRYSKESAEPEIDVTQSISSAATTRKIVPHTIGWGDKHGIWKSGNTNFDIGSGKFSDMSQAMVDRGVENLHYDPFWQSSQDNQESIDKALFSSPETVTVNNILNVIKEPEAQRQVIRQAAKAVDQNGTAFFLIYEGDKSGAGKETRDGYQVNAKAETYLDAVREFFDNVRRDGHLIIATGPKKDLTAGRWSPAEGQPLFSMGSLTSITTKKQLQERIQDYMRSQKTVSWWDKSVGTMYNLAKKDPQHFGVVFELVQDFIDDIAKYANTAADMAPNLLPKTEGLKDAVKGALNMGKDAANSRAIAEPIFQGTLNDKIWSDKELENRFGLNPKQIGLYHEFHAAVNQSLDDLTISDMRRLAKMEGLKEAPADITLEEATDHYQSQFQDQLEKAEVALVDLKDRQAGEKKLIEDAARQDDSDPAQRKPYAEMMVKMRERHATEMAQATALLEKFLELQKGIRGRFDQVTKMKAQGYAPLMRFGDYTVDVFKEVKDANGVGTGVAEKDINGDDVRHFFGMFESEVAANRAVRVLAEEYPNATIKQGILSKEASSLFNGITPETVDVYARLEGQDASEALQKYLRTAVNNRSAMKRLIHRLGIQGFSEDSTRVLASFLTSNARAAARNDHFGDMLRAAVAIPKEKGDVKDAAIGLMQYIQNPEEEASALRGVLFMNYLGGSVASGLVNMTQPFLMTYPYLHQFSKSAGKHLAWGLKLAGKKMFGKDVVIEGDEELSQALHRAKEEGITDPHEIHMLYGESSRTGAFQNNRFVRNMTHVWGSFFALSEAFNRHATFLAAYKIAQENNLSGDKAYDFAKEAVRETQGVYNKGNRPAWARGSIGATLFTFKQFSIAYMEFLKRLPAKERAIALGILILAAGVSGLPGSDDLDDLIDTLGQSFGLGLTTNTKQWKKDFVAKVFGKDAAGFILYGMSHGLPLDVAGRMSAGNLIPASGVLKRSEVDKTRAATEFFGPVASFGQNFMKAWGHMQDGNFWGVAKDIAPKAASDLGNAIDMIRTGEYHDTRGRKVDQATTLDAVIKGIGFQPTHLAEGTRERSLLQQNVNLMTDVRNAVFERWAQGRYENDQTKIATAKAELDKWNRENPTEKITLNVGAIQRKVVEMGRTANERFIKAAPKQIRREVAGALNE